MNYIFNPSSYSFYLNKLENKTKQNKATLNKKIYFGVCSYGDGGVLEQGLGGVGSVDDVDEGGQDRGHIRPHVGAWEG